MGDIKYGKNRKRFCNVEDDSSTFVHRLFSARKHFSMELKWQIWFADDCGHSANLKNYEIQKDNMTIFTLTEEKMKNGEYRRLGQTTELFPSDASAEDECGEMTDDERCDHDKSKWKYVVLRFHNIQPGKRLIL